METIYCPDRTYYWMCWSKPTRDWCHWVDVKFDELEVCARKKVGEREEEEIRLLGESFAELAKGRDISGDRAPVFDAEIDEERLELHCLPTPEWSLQTDSSALQLSTASAEFARRGRGLPLAIAAGGEEQAE